jgi:ABC-type phosphate/phosphonate transport system substrate-binding protein
MSDRLEMLMRHEPPRRPTFLTTILPTALAIFTIAALVLIFGALGGGTPARRNDPPTSEARVEGTAEATIEDDVIEITAEAATLEATEQSSIEVPIAPTPILGSRGKYTLMLIPASDLGNLPYETPLVENADGFEITAHMPATYEESIEALCNGAVDMAVLNSLAYLIAHERGCVASGIASENGFEATYTVQIIASEHNTAVQTIQDAKGKRFCRSEKLQMSDRAAVTEILLRVNGIDWETDFAEVVVLADFTRVLADLYSEKCDVGLIFSDNYYAFSSEILYDPANQFEVILAESPPIGNEVLAFSPVVSAERQQAIIDELIVIIDESSEGITGMIAVMGQLAGGWGRGVPLDDTLYDPLRQFFEAAGENIEDYVR